MDSNYGYAALLIEGAETSDFQNQDLPFLTAFSEQAFQCFLAAVGGGSEGKIFFFIYPPALDLWLSHAYRVEIQTKLLFTQQNSSY